MSKGPHPARPSPDPRPSVTMRLPSVEAYETESGAVIFDAYQPLAWIESSAAVPIDDVT